MNMTEFRKTKSIHICHSTHWMCVAFVNPLWVSDPTWRAMSELHESPASVACGKLRGRKKGQYVAPEMEETHISKWAPKYWLVVTGT